MWLWASVLDDGSSHCDTHRSCAASQTDLSKLCRSDVSSDLVEFSVKILHTIVF